MVAALDPDSCKVDERSHRDRLAFAAGFSRLIRYYDKHNQAAGDWRGFFLKDPAVLLAAISQADPDSYFTTFAPHCLPAPNLLALAQEAPLKPEPLKPEELALVRQLCALLRQMFVMMNLWLGFMSRQAGTYLLYEFLLQQIQQTLSRLLQRTIALQQLLNIEYPEQIDPPDFATHQEFEAVWHSWHDALNEKDEQRTAQQRLAALSRIYEQVYGVFRQVVEYAAQAFQQHEGQPTPYPDTALLIVFSRLMEMQQAQINQLGRQHLDFYYDAVLRQTTRPGQADQVIICLKLSEKAGTLSLPAQTAFKAGVYADGSDILFVNQEAGEFGRASIAQLYTQFYQEPGLGAGLYRDTVATPDQLLRNAAQEVRCWDAFGRAQGSPVQQGFALASPMLLLQGGTRTVTIKLQLPGTAWRPDDARYYFSTAKGWWEATPSLPPSSDAGQCTLQFVLPPGAPAIVALKPAAGEPASVWPMFKVMLGAAQNLRQAPTLEAVSIAVAVQGFDEFALANDTSVLPPIGAVQLFGPVPAQQDSFYAGSNECFAKPLSAFTLTINWDQLPTYLSQYYAAYNSYLRPKAALGAGWFSNAAFKATWDLLDNKSWTQLLAARDPAQTGDPLPAHETPLFQQVRPDDQQPDVKPGKLLVTEEFPNAAQSGFKLSFAEGSAYRAVPELALAPLPLIGSASDGYLRLRLSQPEYAFGHSLYAKLVADISMKNAQTLIAIAKEQPKSADGQVLAALKDAMAAIIGRLNKFLAEVRALPGKLAALMRRIFHRQPAATVPQDATAQTQLAAPAEPAAGALLLELPNLPYSPKLLSLSADYEAECKIAVTQAGQAGNYPFELYHYGGFLPYLAYDARTSETGPGFAQLNPAPDPTQAGKLALFPGVAGAGTCYLALSDVSASEALTLFVDLLTDNDQPPANADSKIWFCWSVAGWTALEVLQDQTRCLTRSGIVKLAMPASVPACLLMPGEFFWLAAVAPDRGRRIQFRYLNTQALVLGRSSVESVPPGAPPVIAEGAIVSTLNKMAQIAAVSQPFPSFGGQPAEDRSSYDAPNSYYRRVSNRLRHKDRGGSSADYVTLAFEACPGLYHARVLPGAAGVIDIGLVNSYQNAQQPQAFAPTVGAADSQAIEQYLAQRAPATAQIQVHNLLHQALKIDVTLVIAPGTNASTLSQQLNHQLCVYLAPWIASSLPQMDFGRGLSRSALASMLAAQSGVLAVADLRITRVGDTSPCTDDPILAGPGAILVPAPQHGIALQVGQGSGPAIAQEVAHG